MFLKISYPLFPLNLKCPGGFLPVVREGIELCSCIEKIIYHQGKTTTGRIISFQVVSFENFRVL